MNETEELKNASKKFNKIVIWGLKNRWHTHRFVFKSYYRTLKKYDIPVVWVEDEKKNQKIIEKNDLIFTASGMYGKMVPEKKSLADYNVPIRDDVYYCLHAENDFFIEKIKPEQFVHLKFYYNEAEKYPKIYEAVHFDPATRTLYQPWGTDLLEEEFKKPTFCKSKFVFWVGSIWNDKNNHGNLLEIAELKKVLKENNLWFINVRFVPDFINTLLIRFSRIAPAIGGGRQVEINYLPDRMFKNISYGQLGITNIKKFNDILGDSFVGGDSIKEIIENALSLSKDEYLKKTKEQQEKIKKYTYKNSLENIFNAFN